MKEDKSVFLKVDDVEPVYKCCSAYDHWHVDGVEVWIGGESHTFSCDSFTVCDPDAVREDGRRQVVALMNELGKMAFADNKKLFGYGMASDILNNFSYTEIVEMLKDWKEEKERIRVRDEVYSDEVYGVRFVVTKMFAPSDGDVIVNGLKKDGTAVKGLLLCNLKKTGLHVDDLDAYLEV